MRLFHESGEVSIVYPLKLPQSEMVRYIFSYWSADRISFAGQLGPATHGKERYLIFVKNYRQKSVERLETLEKAQI